VSATTVISGINHTLKLIMFLETVQGAHGEQKLTEKQHILTMSAYVRKIGIGIHKSLCAGQIAQQSLTHLKSIQHYSCASAISVSVII
jgi:hypothetical protein